MLLCPTTVFAMPVRVNRLVIVQSMVLSQSPELLILEILNFSVNMIFLILFIHRFVVLRSFARTERFKDYFPKIRIFLSMVYVLLNLGLLIETAVQNIFAYTGMDMALVVGGEGINSIILFVQLFVLRMELLKEQPYTRFHLAYFVYLCLFSAVRFVIYLINQREQRNVLSVILSAVLILDSLVLMTYWVMKKQSLPQFQLYTNDEIKSLKHPSKLLQNIVDITERSFRRANDDNFPYIIPFVSVENGKIKIILEISNYSQFIDNCDDSVIHPNTSTNPHPSSSPKMQHLNSLNRATRSQQSGSNGNSREILSVGYYSIQEIKHIYVICSRFPMKKSMSFSFAPLSLPEVAREMQDFLVELFRQKRWYQPSVLKYLKIPLDRMKEYSELVEKYSVFNKETDLDQTLGCKVEEDKNAIFFSLSIYKHLWVDDHYEFYIRVVPTHSLRPYYPIKRFSEFQDFHHTLKQKIRAMERDLALPLLPKKHLFHWDQDQEINQRRAELERYLRLLYNDYTIVGVPLLQQPLLEFLSMQEELLPADGNYQEQFYQGLTITKGQVSKCLIRNDLVTYYELKVFRQGLQEASLWKRFSQFEQLHHELQRWMNNIQITYKAVALPQRLYYKSQAIRHEKLKLYLQNVVEIPRIGRIYAVNTFFNMENNDSDQISQIRSHSRAPQRSGFSNVINEVIIELTENNDRPPEERLSHSSEASSRRFSQMINNLGDD